MAIIDMPTNVSWEFNRDSIDTNFANLQPINLTAGSTISAATTVAQYVGHVAILQTTATATVKMCTALRAAVSASDTWVAVTVS